MEQMPFIEIPLYGKYGRGKATLVDGDYDGEYFAQYKWYVNPSTGLCFRREYSNGKNSMVTLHTEVSKPPKGMWVKHLNKNKLDNRNCNLEWTTPEKSALTRLLPSKVGNNKYRGVSHPTCKSKNRKLWVGKNWKANLHSKHLGTYRTEEEAAKVYDVAAKEKYGKLARLNFPE